MQQAQSKYYSKWWKTENVPSKIRNKTRVPTLTKIIQYSSGSPICGNQRRERNKRNPDWKGGSRTLSICRWHDILLRKPYRYYQKIVLSFVWAKMRTAAKEATPQISLRDCSKEAVERKSICKVLVKMEFNTTKASPHFTKVFLLVMRIWCHHEKN